MYPFLSYYFSVQKKKKYKCTQLNSLVELWFSEFWRMIPKSEFLPASLSREMKTDKVKHGNLTGNARQKWEETKFKYSNTYFRAICSNYIHCLNHPGDTASCTDTCSGVWEHILQHVCRSHYTSFQNNNTTGSKVLQSPEQHFQICNNYWMCT